MREFVEITKAAGKVIEGVSVCAEQANEVLAVTFTDGTYSCVSHWYDESGMHFTDLDLTDIPKRVATRLGIASASEYRQFIEASEKKRLKEHEDRQRQEYLRLKAKFEGGR